MSRRADRVGQKLGRLLVTGFHSIVKQNSMWVCKCDCGKVVIRNNRDLRPPGTHSCGCFMREFHLKGFKDIPLTYWNRVKKQAADRGIEMSLSIEAAWELYNKQDKKCALSGVPIGFNHSRDYTASLDRINYKQGYSVDNVQWVHKTINIMKNKLNNEDFVHWCSLVEKRSS